MNPLLFRYSTLKTAEFCPLKFKYQEVDGIPEPGPRSINLAFGTAIHAAIEAHFSDLDAVEVFKLSWAKIDPKEHDDTYSRQGHVELALTGEEILRKWVKLHAKKYEPLHLEKELLFKIYKNKDPKELSFFEMKGTVDFIGKYNGKLSIVDWKTSATDFDKNKPLYDLQLWLYAHAVEQILNLKVEQIVYSPFVKYGAKVQTPVCYSVTEEKMQEMLKIACIKMQEIVSWISRDSWPRNTSNCSRCPFFKRCYEK